VSLCSKSISKIKRKRRGGERKAKKRKRWGGVQKR